MAQSKQYDLHRHIEVNSQGFLLNIGSFHSVLDTYQHMAENLEREVLHATFFMQLSSAEDQVVHCCKELIEVGRLVVVSVVWSLARVVVHRCFVIARKLPPSEHIYRNNNTCRNNNKDEVSCAHRRSV